MTFAVDSFTLASLSQQEITLANLSPDGWGGQASQGQDKFMYVKISSPASPHPYVEILARPPGATTGNWVDITAAPGDMDIIDEVHGSDYPAGKAHKPQYDSFTKVLSFWIEVVYGGTEIEWLMRITNRDSSEQEFIWVIATTEGESFQPWIDVTPAALTYDVLVNENSVNTAQKLTVANKGTGQLIIIGTDPPLGAYFTLSTPTGSVSVDPNNSVDLDVTFYAPSTPPVPDGKTEETSTIKLHPDKPDDGAGTTAGHNKQFELKATTRKLEVTLLLDASGSMGWAPDGSFLPAGSSQSRWSELISAASIFLNLLATFGEGKGTFGIARFPPSDANYDIVLPTTIPPKYSGTGPVTGTMNPHITAVSVETPTDNTPMGDGLDHVLKPSTNYFSTDPTDIAVNRRWLLLMSDGAHNSGTVDPRDFIPPTDNILEDERIKLFTIGYGTENAPSYSVDWPLLQELAAGSLDGGDTRRVDVENLSAQNLADAFKAAIMAGINPAITSPSDPSGVLRSGAAEARHEVIITPYDTKAAFILHWNTPAAERMELQLWTPTGDLITPKSAGGDSGEPGITFSDDLRYQMYTINYDYLRNANDPSRPRYGTWTLIVSSSKLAEGDSESYSHDVIVESRLRMDVRLDRGIYYAGDQIGLSAALTLNGRPVTNAAVTVCLTTPGHFTDNWLAAARISDEEYKKAAETLAGQDVTALFIKAYAARLKGITFKPFTTSDTIAMTDPSNEGVCKATAYRTWTPGGYTFYVTAIGQTEDGVLFRREKEIQVRVGVQPDPESTLIDVEYHRIPDIGPGVIGAEITVWPKDRFGNVLLVDPAISPSIQLTAEGGEFTGPVVGNLDGSYSRSLRFARGTTPLIGLQVAGREIVREFELAPVDRLHYVDQVIEFHKGTEAAEGANKHDDPQAVLGDVIEKDPERFVSLGGFGSITVGFKGQAILATGNGNDITVFVRRDQGLRPYLVEALPGGNKKDWVELSTSRGVTQSFSLGKAGLNDAVAIRIIDQSGVTVDSDFSPIPSPGVSIRGVGVKRVGRLPGTKLTGCLGRILSIITLGLIGKSRKIISL